MPARRGQQAVRLVDEQDAALCLAHLRRHDELRLPYVLPAQVLAAHDDDLGRGQQAEVVEDAAQALRVRRLARALEEGVEGWGGAQG